MYTVPAGLYKIVEIIITSSKWLISIKCVIWRQGKDVNPIDGGETKVTKMLVNVVNREGPWLTVSELVQDTNGQLEFELINLSYS